MPIAFRQSATDADNHGVATVAAVYAQDQIEWSPQVQTIVGLRYDRFEVDFRNNRTALNIGSLDHLVSPRAGIVYKPVAPLSLYTSYSLAYVPRAGEQLSSLSLTNQALEPERFINYEVGAKWDAQPELSVTAAIYKLDRTNVAIPDPVDPTRSLLVAGQRTQGFELGVTGNMTPAWTTVGRTRTRMDGLRRRISATAQVWRDAGTGPRAHLLAVEQVQRLAAVGRRRGHHPQRRDVHLDRQHRRAPGVHPRRRRAVHDTDAATAGAAEHGEPAG